MEVFGGGEWWCANPGILEQTSKWKTRTTYPVFIARNFTKTTQS